MKKLAHRFVEELPVTLEDGILYVSLEYNTVAHLCACGCGSETVTPLERTEWKLTYDGEAISLHPSVGNWSLPCRSHYVVRDGLVHWAGDWTDEEIEAGRRADRRLKENTASKPSPIESPKDPVMPSMKNKVGLLSKAWRWFQRK